jgi:hypothetical protein
MSEIQGGHPPEPPRAAYERPAVSWDELALVVVGAAFVFGWCWAATGTPSLAVAMTGLGAFAAYYAVGTLAASWTRLWLGITVSFASKLVTGFALVNTALFVVAAAHLPALQPTSVGVVAVAVAMLARSRPRLERVPSAGWIPPTLATGLSLVAATLWAQDCLPPVAVTGEITVFKPWVDSFYHAAQIASMSGVHQNTRMEQLHLAFVPAPLYHYAPYVLPAVVKAFSSITAYGAYAGVLVPFGIFLTGMGAYALVSSWWGAWPGFAATAALLLLPDAASQGTGNGYLGYHWMQNVGPAGMYGVAVLALAWSFVLRGCRARSALQLGAGWVLGALAVAYKAQFFVASALLLWMYPPAAMRGVSIRRRAAWFLGAFGVYTGAVVLANRSGSFPLMRLDGSATRDFIGRMLLGANNAPGAFRDFFEPHLLGFASQAEFLGYGAVYLAACAVGGFMVAYGILAVWLRRRVDVAVLVFPGLVLSNFVVMGLLLAYDDRGLGAKEELLHRPFVWAYFVMAAWVGGASALAVLGDGASARWRRLVLAGAAVALLVVPARRGADGVQNKEGWSLARMEVPTAYLDVARFLRTAAAPGDIAQDSHGDPYVVLAAMSERRPFVVSYWMPIAYGREEAAARRSVVSWLKAVEDPAILGAAARDARIRWLVLSSGDHVAWPRAVLDHPAFASGGYRVYKLY